MRNIENSKVQVQNIKFLEVHSILYSFEGKVTQVARMHQRRMANVSLIRICDTLQFSIIFG